MHFSGATDEIPGNSPGLRGLELFVSDVVGAPSVRENIVGEVQAVGHSGAYAIVLRHKALTNGIYDSQIVRIPIGATGGGERVLVDGGQLDYARLTTDDARVLLLRAGTTCSSIGPFGGAQTSVHGSGAEPLAADVRP